MDSFLSQVSQLAVSKAGSSSLTGLEWVLGQRQRIPLWCMLHRGTHTAKAWFTTPARAPSFLVTFP